MMHVAGLIDPRLIILTLFGSSALFLFLTLTANFFYNRGYIFTSGKLIIVSNIMAIMNILNWFIKSNQIQNMLIHLGVAVTAGFVLYDTQLVMEKFRSGDQDSINHSLCLFFDLISLSRKGLMLVKTDDGD